MDPPPAVVFVTRRLPAILVTIIAVAMTVVVVADGPGPTRSADMEGSCPVSLQTLINNTPTGATLTVPACVYRETVTISRAMTVNGYGAVIDGRDPGGTPVRAQWLFVSANDVTVRGFTMRYAAGTNAAGSVENAVGVQRFVLEDCDLGSSYVNLNLTGAIDSVIRNCSIHDARHLGVRVSAPSPTANRGQRNALIGNRIYSNNKVGEPDPGADAAGIKITGQDGFTMSGNEVYDNAANGLWLDVWCRNSVISNNRVHDNAGPGIMDETSSGSKINGNVVWRNGFADKVWGWGAGILISSSKDAEVWDNTVAWNWVGISVIDQQRSDSPGVTGNYVHDNVITEQQMAAGNDHFGLFWAYDYTASQMYTTGANNRGLNNRFYYANADGSQALENSYARFIWNGYQNLASFVTVPGGTGSGYMSATSASVALTGKGIPTKP